jgi:hypothetical protein
MNNAAINGYASLIELHVLIDLCELYFRKYVAQGETA